MNTNQHLYAAGAARTRSLGGRLNLLKGLTFTLILVFLGCTSATTQTRGQSAPGTNAEQPAGKSLVEQAVALAQSEEVRDRVEKMSPEEQLGQLIMPIFNPTWAQRENYLKLIRECHLGGILFQKGTAWEQYRLTRYLQEKNKKLPLLISLDGEWGLAMRLTDALKYPRMAELSHLSEEDLRQYGEDVARQCRVMGIHVNFSPVMDVNNNPKNPVIGTRSFGSDVQTVIRCALPYAQGLEAGGVLSVAKHFPGHGNTSADSHKTLPVVNGTRNSLNKTELAPFRAYINAHLGGIMSAHLFVPALDSTPGTPSSLSPKIVTDLLQGEMGFRGLIFTDGLGMQGVQSKGTQPIAVRALLAGNDILLGATDTRATYRQLLKAYKEGTLSPELIRDKCAKVLAWKIVLGLPIDGSMKSLPEYKTKEEFYEALNPKDLVEHNREIWRKSQDKSTPPAPNDTVPAEQKAQEEDPTLQLKAQKTDSVPKTEAQAPENIAPEAEKGNSNPNQPATGSDRSAHGPLAPQDRALPFQNSPLLFENTLPADNDRPRKPDEDRFRELDNIALQGIKLGAYPGCQVAVLHRGKPVYLKSFGTLSYKKGAQPVTVETLYDVASLSKVLATTPAIMQLVGSEKLRLNDTVEEILPEFKGSRAGKIRVKELLLHCSGLPPVINFYLELLKSRKAGENLLSYSAKPGWIFLGGNVYGNPQTLYNSTYVRRERSEEYPVRIARKMYLSRDFYTSVIVPKIREANLSSPGSYRYTDVGFLLLGRIIEAKSGLRLDEYVQQNIYRPMGLDRITYLPLDYGYTQAEIAPTQNDKFLRKEEVCGRVEDETALCMGGVCGNAGVFANAYSVALLGEMFLREGQAEHKRIIPAKAVRQFVSTKGAGGKRYLGFMANYKGNSNLPESASALTYGHTGFTGTALWIDPAADLVFVFLSNRTHPNRTNGKLMSREIRPRLMQAVYRAIGK